MRLCRPIGKWTINLNLDGDGSCHRGFLTDAAGDAASEVIQADGLREEVVHTSFAAGFPNAGESMACHGDDGGLLFEQEVPANFAGGVDAAQHGHLKVHEDHVVLGLGNHFNGLLSVIGDVNHGVSQTLQQHGGYLLVQGLVFDQQDAGGILVGKGGSRCAGGAGKRS